ncbi:exodeoxyribonuclease V subunit alpha [Alkanindiges sp. WGS2144]|uniref:exodeoxyribonuclease V subunit alpha n=1 Tax=Alkanindiges sp. WGS2144 TaxID=3366808 RepID=UPI003753D528
MDKPVDNTVNKSVDNPDFILDTEENAWFVALAEHLAQLYPFLKDCQKDELKQIIVHLGRALEAGHTCLLIDQHSLNSSLMQHPAIVDEATARQQPAPLVRAEDYLYFYRQWQQENLLAEQLTRILEPVRAVSVQFDASETANTLQRQAIVLAARHSFSLITGGPGTGKTYTLVRIVKALQQAQPDLRIALAAPTGKAAQRMQSVLDTAFRESGIESSHIQTAQTVHRLLGLGSNGKPRYHAQAPLPYDLIVLDEGSMLDLALASLLFAAIAAGTRLIILGDADQLAAVDAGAVLADLQQTPALKSYQIHLTESKRFSATQGIGQLATAILQQDISQFWQAFIQSPQQLRHVDPQTLTDQQLFEQLWQGFIPYAQALKAGDAPEQLFAAFDTYRILTAMRAGHLGTQKINQEMSKRLQVSINGAASTNEWFVGRPVMMNRNDYGLQLSNGDIGLCLQDEQGKWQVYFPHLKQGIAITRLPLHEITTAFALTIHKSQGSEFNHVAVIIESAAKELLSRELLYTAVTRARQKVDLWGEQISIEQALKNKALRHTGFKRLLQKMVNSDNYEHKVTST